MLYKYANGEIYKLLKLGCVISGSFVMDQLYLDNFNVKSKTIDVFCKGINFYDEIVLLKHDAKINTNIQVYSKEIEIFAKYNFSLDKIIMY